MQDYREYVVELGKFLPEAVNRLESIVGQSMVLFMGVTGSGKSTLICYLEGGEFRYVTVDHVSKKLERVGNSVRCPTIGNNPYESQTFSTECFPVNGKEFSNCDTAGWCDTETVARSEGYKEAAGVLSTISNQLAIEKAKDIKAAVITIPFSFIWNEYSNPDQRSASFRNTIHSLKDLFNNPEILKDAIDNDAIFFAIDFIPEPVKNNPQYLDNPYELKKYCLDLISKYKDLMVAKATNIKDPTLNEKVDIALELMILDAIKLDNIILPNLTDNSPAAREEIIAKLDGARGIKKPTLRINNPVDGSMVKFRNAVISMAVDGKALLNNLDNYPKLIADQNEQLDQIIGQLDEIEHKLASNDDLGDLDTRIYELEAQNGNLARQNKQHVKDLAKMEAELAEIDKKIAIYDTGEGIDYRPLAFKSNGQGGYTWYSAVLQGAGTGGLAAPVLLQVPVVGVFLAPAAAVVGALVGLATWLFSSNHDDIKLEYDVDNAQHLMDCRYIDKTGRSKVIHKDYYSNGVIKSITFRVPKDQVVDVEVIWVMPKRHVPKFRVLIDSLKSERRILQRNIDNLRHLIDGNEANIEHNKQLIDMHKLAKVNKAAAVQKIKDQLEARKAALTQEKTNLVVKLQDLRGKYDQDEAKCIVDMPLLETIKRLDQIIKLDAVEVKDLIAVLDQKTGCEVAMPNYHQANGEFSTGRKLLGFEGRVQDALTMANQEQLTAQAHRHNQEQARSSSASQLSPFPFYSIIKSGFGLVSAYIINKLMQNTDKPMHQDAMVHEEKMITDVSVYQAPEQSESAPDSGNTCSPALIGPHHVPTMVCTGEKYTAYIMPKIEGLSDETAVINHVQTETTRNLLDGESYSKSSCRSVEFFGRKALHCDGKNTTVSVIPHLKRQFDGIDGQLILFNFAIRLGQKAYKWFNEIPADKLKVAEEIENNKLKSQCEIPGLLYQAIPGDGHCLFNSVALYLGRDANQLRAKLFRYIQRNVQEYREIIQAINPGRTPEQYLEDLRNGVEWADNLEISLLMTIFNRPIVVIGQDGRIRNKADLHGTGDPIFVHYNGHNHYDAFVLTGTIKAKEIMNDLVLSTELPEVIMPAENVEQKLYEMERILDEISYMMADNKRLAGGFLIALEDRSDDLLRLKEKHDKGMSISKSELAEFYLGVDVLYVDLKSVLRKVNHPIVNKHVVASPSQLKSSSMGEEESNCLPTPSLHVNVRERIICPMESVDEVSTAANFTSMSK